MGVTTSVVAAATISAVAVAYATASTAIAAVAALASALGTLLAFAYGADDPLAWLALGVVCKCTLLSRAHRRMIARAYASLCTQTHTPVRAYTRARDVHTRT
jgi:hypothetical protein